MGSLYTDWTQRRSAPSCGWRLTATAGCLGGLLLATSVLATNLDTPDRLRFADGLYARGMHKMAIQEYRGFLENPPDVTNAAVAYFRLGECYRKLGNRPEAEKAFRTVFNQYADSEYRLKAGCKRADLFMDTGEYGAALDLFAVVLAEDPPPELAAACRYFSGEAHLKLGRPDEALMAFEGVVKDFPDTTFKSYALLKIGEIHATIKQDETSALDYFKQAAETTASDRVKAESLFQVAEYYFRSKAYETSADYYRKLLTLYPSDARSIEAALQAAWAAYYAGLYAEALDRAGAAVAAGAAAGDAASAASRAEWLYLKANCERQLMQNADAIKTYAGLLEHHPRSAFADAARYERAVAYFKSGSFRQAIEAAARVESEGKLKKDILWLRAESHAALKQDAEAIQYYRLLIREFPDSELSRDATYRLAHHLQARGDNQEAVRQYHQLVERYPDSPLAPQALFAAGVCLLRDELPAAAIRDWSALITRYPQSEYVEKALYQSAMSAVRLERDAEALQLLRDLLKRFPATTHAADASYWTGMLSLQAGQLADAQASFRQTLQAQPRPDLAHDAAFYLGLALKQEGKGKEALAQLQPLVDQDRTKRFTPQLLTWMAEAFFDAGDFRKALSTAGALMARHPEDSWQQMGFAIQGRCYAAQKDDARAADAFQKALACLARTRFAGEAALRLGDYALLADDLDVAGRYFTRASTLASDPATLGIRAHAYAGLGQVAQRTGDHEAASRYFMSVAILYDDAVLVPACLAGAVRAFKALGQDDAAGQARDELRQRYPDSAEWKALAPPAS